MFKKKTATFIEKMNTLQSVTVTPDEVKFKLDWSEITVTTEKIPKLVSDFMQLYSMVKDSLDEKTEKENKEKKKDNPDAEPVDLSDIPF